MLFKLYANKLTEVWSQKINGL